jgi:F0F1-type ATP synthase membrane subunit a
LDGDHSVAAEQGKIDPMHQFEVQTIFDGFNLGGYQIAFTNSALWMVLTVGVLWLFMLGGMKRELVPGRWQAAVEGVTGFISNMMTTNQPRAGRAQIHALCLLAVHVHPGRQHPRHVAARCLLAIGP